MRTRVFLLKNQTAKVKLLLGIFLYHCTGLTRVTHTNKAKRTNSAILSDLWRPQIKLGIMLLLEALLVDPQNGPWFFVCFSWPITFILGVSLWYQVIQFHTSLGASCSYWLLLVTPTVLKYSQQSLREWNWRVFMGRYNHSIMLLWLIHCLIILQSFHLVPQIMK